MTDQKNNNSWVDEAYGKSHFEKLKVNIEAWTALYRCPKTGELWKRYYPFPESHGGGPARFIKISQDEALKEFDFKT